MLENGTVETTNAVTERINAQRSRLLADLQEAATIPDIDVAALDALRDKLAARVFNLVVAGEFKRGKSSVINALLGAEVLPTGVVPVTSIVTVLRHGESPSATVMFETGKQATIELDALADYVTERGNPQNQKRVKDVEVAFPAPWLGQGIRLVDTPGIGSAHRHNTDVTYEYLPRADAVIFVASVEQPVSHSELQFLADIRAWADRVFCLLNKIDHLSQAELAESVAFSTAALREALGVEVPVFPVSARMAIQARHASADDAWARSGFAAFDAALRRFLQRDSGEVLVRSVRRHLSRLLSGCRLAAELELQALAAPLAKLDENLRAFESKKAETMQQRSDFDALLAADARGLVKEKIEPDIVDFKRVLTKRLDAQVPGWFLEAEAQHEMSSKTALEQRIVGEVRRAFDVFRENEDSTASAEFNGICGRFQLRIQQSADELMRYSAELFAIQFEAVTAEPLRAARSHFYYKFWEEPTGITLLGRSLTTLLPRPLRRPLLLRRARRRTAELVEMQSGRLRHDFEQRIMRATQDARKEMVGRLDATIEAIEAAVAKGRALKSSGQDAVKERRRQITVMLDALNQLAAHAQS